MNFLANCLTLLSLLCGFISVIFSLETHFTFASWAIILAVIFDGMDGQIARRNPIPSEFGKELDSLVDVVSFGIAPAILGYIFIYRDFYPWASLALFIYLTCSVMRLAKYNIIPKEKMVNYFYGLPTTVSGGLLASFILIYRKGKDISPLPQSIPLVFLIIVIVLSFLMVSRARYLNLDGLRQLLGKKTKLVVFLLIILLILATFLKKAGVTLFTLFLIYLLFSPFVVKRLNSTQPR
ncbi:MAG: CDP-diacylglycerol--serine O-phosphatidyltransferase [Candidatus Omnitrophota bacterium]